MAERERLKVYVTKYALTAGILIRDVELCSDISTDMVSGGAYENYHGDDWHRTFEEAVAHAERMRAKKIASLKKQIGKLETLTFSHPEAKAARP